MLHIFYEADILKKNGDRIFIAYRYHLNDF